MSENTGANTDEVCSSADAAKLLGVSPSTIQKMVERGVLDAWKTMGGHRRILRASVEALRAYRETASPSPDVTFTVLLVEDDRVQRQVMADMLSSFHLPMQLIVADDGLDAIFKLERERPDVIISDLCMDPIDGFKLLSYIDTHTEYRDMDILIVTMLDSDEISRRGGIPQSVIVYQKPPPFSQIRGVIEGALARKRRRRSDFIREG